MIEARNLKKYFPIKDTIWRGVLAHFRKEERYVRAVNGVSFSIRKKEMMGLAGESGSGKTTTGMLLLRLYPPTDGELLFEGKDVSKLKGKELTYFRRNAQLIFQDPYESLNPRFTVRRTIEEPLIANDVEDRNQRKGRVLESMERVKLTPVEAFLDKYPHELSGGERQRVCIARAIVLEPILLVADEATSMLDVSIRAGILSLLRELTEDIKMATLYISHDLSLLGSICDKIAIMYAGEILEMGRPEDIVESPLHPYTRALIAAVPVPEFTKQKGMLMSILGEPPDLINVSKGCSYKPRCLCGEPKCSREKPSLRKIGDGHFVACNRVGGLS